MKLTIREKFFNELACIVPWHTDNLGIWQADVETLEAFFGVAALL